VTDSSSAMRIVGNVPSGGRICGDVERQTREWALRIGDHEIEGVEEIPRETIVSTTEAIVSELEA